MTNWWARIDLPEEFRNGIGNKGDIVDFVFGKRRIEGTKRTTFAVTCSR